MVVSYNEIKKYLEFEIFGLNSFLSKFIYFMFSIVKKFTLSFREFSIFHWLIVSTFVWILTHGLYLKCMQLLFQRIGVNKKDQKRLIETIWHLSFTVISVPVIVSCVGVSIDVFSLTGGWVDELDYQLAKCKIHDEISVPGVKTVFVLHSSFSFHDFVNTWYSKGFKNLEFLEKQVFLTVFILTYYSKCPLFGLSVLFLLHRTVLVELLSKLCCLFSNFTQSVTLRYFAKGLFSYYLLLWSVTFLYTFPVFLTLNKTIDSFMLKAELKTLIVMDFLMWIYLVISMIISIFSRVMLSVALPKQDRPRTLDYFLFGSDLWFPTLSKRFNIAKEKDKKDARSKRKKAFRAS